MEAIIKYAHSGFKAVQKRIVKKAINSQKFVEVLQEAVNSVYKKGTTDYSKVKVAIEIIKRYIEQYGMESIIPDENFLLLLREKLNTDFPTKDDKLYSKITIQQVVFYTRSLINRYLAPKGIINRELFQDQVFKKYQKILSLTEKSQEALAWYEKNGCGIKSKEIYFVEKGKEIKSKYIYNITGKSLSPLLKYSRINRVLAILRYCQKKGFEQIIKEDLEKYSTRIDKKGGSEGASKDLAEALNVFVNFKEGGFITENPFENFRVIRIAHNAKKDFITKEGIEKIRDLSTLNYKDRLDVRNRLVCLLLYDTALRKTEALLLKSSDIVRESDGMVRITLRGEIQKGKKDTVPLYIYFEETKKLLEYYLKKTRKSFNPKDESLFVAESGKGLSGSRLRDIVKQYCAKLEVRTFYNQEPSPHTFRHSFATLNISPLGAFPLDGIVERLRHVGYDTAKKHYIHNNPYLQRLKHIEYQKNGNNGNILNRVSLDNLQKCLKEIGVDKATVKMVTLKYKEYSVDKTQSDVVTYVSEEEACENIVHLDIPVFSLRKYCLENKLCKRRETGVNKKYVYKYSQNFINDLAENWVPHTTIMRELKLYKVAFYRKAKAQNWKTMTMGKIVLVRRQDIIR